VAWNPDAWLSVPAQLAAIDDDAPRDRRDHAAASAAARAESAVRARALGRDEAALAAIYGEHAPAVMRFLRDLLGCPAAAADATQETFVRAFRRLDTLRETERLGPWLFGIARNVSLEHRRARRVRARVLAPESGEPGSPAPEGVDGRTPEAELLGREAARVVEKALQGLSEDRRAMLLLRLDHGLAYEEIAALMGFSLAKVKVEIHRARQILRAELEAYGGRP
jgi:RNA polymerase sigma-70 factor (ECF subfamily)